MIYPSEPDLAPEIETRSVATNARSIADDPVQKYRAFDPADLFGVLKQYSFQPLEDMEPAPAISPHLWEKYQTLGSSISIQRLQDFLLGFHFHQFAGLKTKRTPRDNAFSIGRGLPAQAQASTNLEPAKIHSLFEGPQQAVIPQMPPEPADQEHGIGTRKARKSRSTFQLTSILRRLHGIILP